jgi:NAD-dependent deacetylase
LRGWLLAAGALADLISRRQPCVVLTGAGVSTESGIPDFRSPTGLWAQFDPLEYGSIEAFRRDPLKVWSFYKPRVAMLTEAAPNPAHLALAELERLGFVEAIVTQNIDLLHERAGSREVVEVHGSIRTATCPGCRASFRLERVLELLAEADAPACPDCSEVLKPDVVFFGENVPRSRVERCTAMVARASALLVVGSSLQVMSGLRFVRQARQTGIPVVIINRGPTRGDGLATLKLDAGCSESLTALSDLLRTRRLEPVTPTAS